MADFTVRVELHKATGEEYGALHEAMERRGYSRYIRTERGTWLLPTAEYSLEGSSMDVTDVRDQALEIAKSVKSYPEPWVLVTESKRRAWSTKKL